MSDLHLEFPENSIFLKQNEIPVTGEILVLAGDIFYLKDKIAPRAKFWKWASENYRQVLIVPGNHEYYNYSDVMERGLQWKWMLRKNVGYYQNQVVSIDDTDFVLSTLWSIMGNCSRQKSIMRCTKFVSVLSRKVSWKVRQGILLL